MNAIPPSFENPWQIRELSQTLANWIDRLGQLWVEAQIAQLTLRPGAYTAYLTLRDTVGEMSVSAIATRAVMESCLPIPAEGDRVIVKGKMEFHRLRGSLQIRVLEFHHIGLGQLLARIEQLRTQLAAEGLFDLTKKKKPPFLPRAIGLITGADSAAQKDVLEVARSRWPAVKFIVRNTLVQGTDAPRQIISALRELDQDSSIDVIIIARGGGSVEDLLPFSNEELCRAVAECTTVVVSAIGHEPDHPLLDDVADVRAATPTDAAKRIVPDILAEEEKLSAASARLTHALRNWLTHQTQLLTALAHRPIFTNPYETFLATKNNDIDHLHNTLRTCGTTYFDQIRSDTDYLENQLLFLSPYATLARGYSIIQRDAQVITSIDQMHLHDTVCLHLVDGKAHATITQLLDSPIADKNTN